MTICLQKAHGCLLARIDRLNGLYRLEGLLSVITPTYV